VASEIVLRIYLTIGSPLCSARRPRRDLDDAMIRRLGGRRWQRLHRGVYVVGIVALITSSAVEAECLGAVRDGRVLCLADGVAPPRAAATRPAPRRAGAARRAGLAAAGATALGEAAWYCSRPARRCRWCSPPISRRCRDPAELGRLSASPPR